MRDEVLSPLAEGDPDEPTLRPRNLDEFVGQPALKELAA